MSDFTSTAALARAGFVDARRCRPMLGEVMTRLGEDSADRADGPADAEGLLADLAASADPDGALLALVRLLDPRQRAADGTVCAEVVAPIIRAGGEGRRRLVALLGGSVALADHLLVHPEHAAEVAAGLEPHPQQIVAAVQHLSGREGTDALRVAYRRQLLRLAAADLTAEDPVALMPQVGAVLAELAGAALEAALRLARTETADEELVDVAVIGMGKTGGRELNYLSDVDVIFLAEPRDEVDEDRAMRAGAALASAVMRICSQSTAEGTLWQVDANLRPEGRDGPVVRSLDSHREYYERWAKTWEFQALLKARHVAGDAALAGRWLGLVRPLVREAAGRDEFVDDVQAMRRRVERTLKKGELDREIKLGPGGLRDIEFSVQLLQLVHGRTDPALASPTTLEGLAALRDGGYVGRDDAAALDAHYRWLRTVEHRVQLHRLRRTHLMPTQERDLRRLGRSLGEPVLGPAEIPERWRSVRREVRRLHERLFYRPLLSAVARLSTEEARLSPEAARARLTVLGFRDPAGAMRHLESLTDGVSRRATIQRHLLPAMLSWFADGADPDAGLLAFRRISDALGTTHWYLGMLRDEGSAAQRLALVLSTSRYAVDLLLRSPESVALLGDAAALVPPSGETLRTRMAAAAARDGGMDERFLAVRAVRARELIRIVLGHLTAGWEAAQVRSGLSDLTDAYLDAALTVAVEGALADRGEEPLTDVALIGMGRLGGHEVGYGSDADVLYVHRPRPGADEERAADQAGAVVAALRRGLSGHGPDPELELDADLRPEGRSGPMVRSLDGYRSYYERWSAGWESQALLRARPVAGDTDLGEAFVAMIEPLRWPAGGISEDAVREIRTLKARMEAERLPRGADPRAHLKLGLGGLSDVEWVAQLLQLRHGHDHAGLRTTRTVETLRAAVEANLLAPGDAERLTAAWDLASRLRDAGLVWRGRPIESVPSHLRDAEGISRVLGREPGHGGELAGDWRRVARRARSVVERLLFGERPGRAGTGTAAPGRGSASGLRRFGSSSREISPGQERDRRRALGRLDAFGRPRRGFPVGGGGPTGPRRFGDGGGAAGGDRRRRPDPGRGGSGS